MPYNLGSIFLQVVPSFDNVQRLARKAGKEAAEEWARGYDEGEKATRPQRQAMAKATGEAEGKAEGEGRAKALTQAQQREEYARRRAQEKREAAEEAHRRRLEAAEAADRRRNETAEQAHQRRLAEQREKQAAKADRDRESQRRKEVEHWRKIDDERRKAEAKDDLRSKRLQDAEFARRERHLHRLAEQEESARRKSEQAEKASERRREQAAAAHLQRQELADQRHHQRLTEQRERAERASRDRLSRQLEKDYRKAAQADPEQFARDVQRALRASLTKMRPVELNVDSTDIDREIARIQTRMAALSDAQIGIDIDAAGAAAELAAIHAAVRALDREDVDIDVRVDMGKALAELGTISTVTAATERQTRATSRLDAASGSAANAFRAMNAGLFALVTVGPLVIPILGAIAFALAGIVGGIMAAVGGIALFAGAMGGIGAMTKALQGAREEEMFDAGESAAQARQRGRAQRDAARAVADARRQGVREVAAAIRRQEDAERSLARAQESARRSQERLSAARRQAVRDIEDLNNALISGALSERQAEFAVQEAAVHLNVVLEDEQATQRERDVAQLGYEQEVQRLRELRLENQRLREEKAHSDRVGVEGSDRVLQATRDVQDATQRVADAEREVSEAREGVNEAQARSAERLARAQERLAETAEANTIATQRMSAAQRNLRLAMLGLSPAGMAFARFLDSLRPLMHELRHSAQESFLPPLQRGMERIVSVYGPRMIGFVTELSRVMGNLAEQTALVFTNPAWQSFFDSMAHWTPIMLDQWGQISLLFAEGLRPILQAMMPFAHAFGETITVLAASFAEWANSERGQAAVAALFQWAQDISPKVFQLIGLAFTVIGKTLIGLAPYAEQLLDFFIRGLGWLATLDPDQLAGVARTIMLIVGAFQLLSTFSAALFTTINLVAGFGTVLRLLASPVGLVVLGILALAAAFVYFYTTNEDFKKWVDDTAAAVKKWWNEDVKPVLEEFGNFLSTEVFPKIQQFWEEELGPILQKIGEGFDTLWTDIIKPILDLWKDYFDRLLGPAISGLWTYTVKPTFANIGRAVWFLWSAVKLVFSAWHWFFTKVLGPVFHWLLDNAVRPVFDDITAIMQAGWRTIEDKILKPFNTAIETLGHTFDNLPNIIADAWHRIQEASVGPANFVIDVVYNKGLRSLMNGIYDVLGIDYFWLAPHPLIELNLSKPTKAPRRATGSSAWASGGVLPGFTPGRDVHHFYSPTAGELHLSGGEGIIRPDALRRLGGKAWLDSVNQGATHDGQHFAAGGVWSGFTGPSDFMRLIAQFFTSGAGILRDVFVTPVRELVRQLGDSAYGQALQEMSIKTVTDAVEKVKEVLVGRGDTGEAYTGPLGKAGKGGWSNVSMGPITSRFGPRKLFGNVFHTGTDIAGGGSIHAAGPGQVIFRGPSNPRYTPGRTGNQVLLRHPGGIFTSYGHIRDGGFFVMPGQMVAPGQKIALQGKTGNVTGVHVHYETHEGGKAVNPEPFMRSRGVELGRTPIAKYDDGGWLPPGYSTVLNATGRPEPVLTTDQFDKLASAARARGGSTIMPNANFYSYDPSDVARELLKRERDAAYLAGLESGGVNL